MLYTRTVHYKGLNGTDKSRVLNFILQRKDVLENMEVFDKSEEHMLNLQSAVQNSNGVITRDQSFELLQTIFKIIKISFAEVDYENDEIDKSENTVNRFLNSLAYEALIKEITDDPIIAFELIEGIGGTIDMNDAEKSKMDELRAKYISKTTRQNDDNPGLSLVEKVEENERPTTLLEDKEGVSSVDEQREALLRQLSELDKLESGVDQ